MANSDSAILDDALETLNKNGWWVFWIFMLASSPGIFNAMHITVYVFFSNSPAHWCHVPELYNANWTNEEIRSISSPFKLTETESCSMYDWNYEELKNIGYNASLEYVNEHKKPSLVPCVSFDYDEPTPNESVDSEWDLVCGRTSLRSTIQVSIAVGKFIGAFIFGVIADKFGRKRSFVLASFLYIIAGPLAAFVSSYYLFIVLRFIIGLAGSGVYESSYTILSEILVKNHRTRLGCVFNISYPIGLIILPVIALYSNNWRTLQLVISLPTLILFLHCWYLPESPRWLLTQGRMKEALCIAKCKEETTRENRQEGDSSTPYQIDSSSRNSEKESSDTIKHPWYKKLLTALQRLFVLFTTAELRNRIFISYFAWFVASLSYYAIALNANNFTANRYLYVALNGVVEAPGYVLPLPLLMYFGRKITSAVLFIISGVALLSILLIPEGYSGIILVVALVGRFCMCAVFAIIILHTSELFPTSIRNTAIGTSLTMAQLGSIAAPFIVDILGMQAWYIPSTICGVVSVLAGSLIMLLPETKDRPMLDSIEEIKKSEPNMRVSIMNCCKIR